MRRAVAGLAGCMALLAGCTAPETGPGVVSGAGITARTAKICQLTGEVDPERDDFTVNLTETRAGLRGTDTGAPVVGVGAAAAHDHDIVFLFGDTVPVRGYDADRPEDGDAIAVMPGGQDPEACLRLDFVAGADGRYLAPRVPGVSLRSYEIPMAGLETDALYVFFVTHRAANHAHGRTLLTRAEPHAQA